MKPFSDTGLTNRQRKFNYQLSHSRVVVENAFGRLKGRWRFLMKCNDNDIKYVPNIVTACCEEGDCTFVDTWVMLVA